MRKQTSSHHLKPLTRAHHPCERESGNHSPHRRVEHCNAGNAGLVARERVLFDLSWVLLPLLAKSCACKIPFAAFSAGEIQFVI